MLFVVAKRAARWAAPQKTRQHSWSGAWLSSDSMWREADSSAATTIDLALPERTLLERHARIYSRGVTFRSHPCTHSRWPPERTGACSFMQLPEVLLATRHL